MRMAAWYAIGVGILMLITWCVSLLSGGVPEFATEPWSIGAHLAAEGATAAVLVVFGIATLRGISWGRPGLLVGLGMVIYSEIASPGYFADRGEWPVVFMFLVLLLLGVGSVWLASRNAG